MLSVRCKHPASESFLKVEKEKNYNFFLTDLLSEFFRCLLLLTEP